MKFTERFGLREGEQLLEHRTLNRHAAIYRLTCKPVEIAAELSPKVIRERVIEITKPNLFRGLAFGVIVSLKNLPENVDDFFEAIDVLQKERSVWQWTIFEISEPKIAIGLHTWMQVRLTEAYEETLAKLKDAGYPVERFQRQNGKVMKILTALQPTYNFPEHKAPR